MYIQIKFYTFLLLLSYTNLLFSQPIGAPFTSSHTIDIDKNADNYLVDAIPSLDGSSLLMVGYSNTNREEGEEVFVVKMKHDGQIVLKEIIGERGSDRGVSIAEDNYNRIIIAGNSKGEMNRPWLILMDSNGDILWKKDLEKPYSTSNAVVKKVFFDKKNNEILCFGIKHNALWVKRVSIKGQHLNGPHLIKEKKIRDLKIVEKQKLSVLYSDGHYFIYCVAQYGEDNTKRPLIVKLNAKGKFVDHVSLSDIHIEAVGGMVDLGSYFGLVGTTFSENITPAEDIYFIKIHKNLNKDNFLFKKINFHDSYYTHSSDIGIDLLPISEEEILVVGNTFSHKRGAQKESILLTLIDEHGIAIDEKPIIIGKSFVEQAEKMILMPDNTIWIVGQQEVKYKRKLNYQVFAGLIEQAPKSNQPIDLNFFKSSMELSFEQTKDNVNNKQAGYFLVHLENRTQFEIAGLKIVATAESDLINFINTQTAIPSLAPGEALAISVPFELSRIARQNSTQAVKLEIIDEKGALLDSLEQDISIERMAAPDLVLAGHEVQSPVSTTIVKGELLELTLSILNKGDKRAENIAVQLQTPTQVSTVESTTKTIHTLAPSATETLTFSLTPAIDFREDSLIISVTIAEETTKVERLAFPIQELSASPRDSEEATLEITWNKMSDDSLLVREAYYELDVTAFSKSLIEQEHFTIEHNNKLIQSTGIKMDEVELKSDKNFYKFKLNLPLVEGENIIRVLVDNGIQVDTTKAILINYVPASKSILRILSIGIEDESGTLAFTEKDAIDFANLFNQQAHFLYEQKKQQILTSKALTTNVNITSTVNKLQSKEGLIREKDVLLLFISGHGFVDKDTGRFKIKASDYDPDNDNSKYASFDFKEDILAVLEAIPCKNLIFIDACKSGEASLDISNITTTNTGILTSCQKGESSYEDKAWKNGALTKVLTDLLSNPARYKKLDTNKDNALSLKELFPSIKKEVQQLVKSKRNDSETQTPVMNANQTLQELPFFYY